MPPAVLPIVSSLAIVGLLPNLPIFNFPEKWWRSFMHRRAAIPQAVEKVREQLQSRGFDYASLPISIAEDVFPYESAGETANESLSDALKSDELTPISKDWLRLSAVIRSIPEWRTKVDAPSKINIGFFVKYRRDLRSLQVAFYDLDARVYRGKAANYHDRVNADTKRNSSDISELLEDTYFFLACVLVRRPPSVTLDAAFALMDFLPSVDHPHERYIEDESDALIVGLGAGLLLSFCLFSLSLGAIDGAENAVDQIAISGWLYSRNLLSWLVTDILRYVPIVFLAVILRKRILKQGRRDQRLRPHDYASIFMWCFVASVACCLIARGINVYLIWQNCASTEGCSDPRKIMTIAKFFETFVFLWWMSPIVLSTFAVAVIMIMEAIRLGKPSAAFMSGVLFILILVFLNFVLALHVYSRREIFDRYLFLGSSTVFYAAVLLFLAIRTADVVSWRAIGNWIQRHARRDATSRPGGGQGAA
jgi:hypothetical protein